MTIAKHFTPKCQLHFCGWSQEAPPQPSVCSCCCCCCSRCCWTRALNATIKQSKCLENRWKSREQPTTRRNVRQHATSTATPPAPSSCSSLEPLLALLAVGNKWKFNVKCAYQRLSLCSASKDHTLDVPLAVEPWQLPWLRRGGLKLCHWRTAAAELRI